MSLALELDHLKTRIDRLAKKTHQPTQSFVTQALHVVEEYLADQEDYYVALAVWKRVEKGKEKLYTRDEVEKLQNKTSLL